MITVCIDPGHGGKDPGAVNKFYRCEEAELNLQMGKLIQDYFNNDPAVKIVMTRENNSYLTLGRGQKTKPGRAGISNNAKADYFISLHHNAFDDPKAEGVEVLYLTQEKLAQNLSRELSKKCFLKNRGAKHRTDLTVLKSTDAPALLIEFGFLTNPTEVVKLVNPDFQKRMAKVVCKFIEGLA